MKITDLESANSVSYRFISLHMFWALGKNMFFHELPSLEYNWIWFCFFAFTSRLLGWTSLCSTSTPKTTMITRSRLTPHSSNSLRYTIYQRQLCVTFITLRPVMISNLPNVPQHRFGPQGETWRVSVWDFRYCSLWLRY